MKKTIFTFAVALTLSFVYAATTFAETVYIGTNNSSAWGTANSDVYIDAYKVHAGQASTLPSDTDSWEQRLFFMERYLKQLGGTSLSTSTTDVADGSTNPSNPSAAGWNANLLSTKAHTRVGDVRLSESKQVYNTYADIWGRKADAYSETSTAVTEAWFPLLRNSDTTSVHTSTVLSSSATYSNDENPHHWTYDSSTDTMHVYKDAANVAGDHNTGIYAFVTGFTYSDASQFDYLNGWFSVLGDLVGIYINGEQIDIGSYYWASEEKLNSNWFSSYDFEIDLAGLFADNIVKEGNNNISFLIDAQPISLEGNWVDHSSGANQYDDGLVAFAAGAYVNTESINPSATPEPATILIFGLGLAGLGLRRRFAKKS